MRSGRLFGLFLLACPHASPTATKATPAAGPGPGTAGAPAVPAPAIAAFETVRSVLQSPRCVNCHPAGDVPLQGDDSHLHEPPIRRGPEGRGVAGAFLSARPRHAKPPVHHGSRTPRRRSSQLRTAAPGA